MAYGLKILNRFGEDVVELDKGHYYAYETGTTKLLDTLNTEGVNAMSAAGYSTANFGDTTDIFTPTPDTAEPYSPRTHVATASGTFTIVATSPDKGLIHPTMNLIDGDLVFYDVSTYGMLMSYTMMSYGFTDATPIGGFDVVEAEGGNALPYTVVSTRKPITSPPTNYGLQIFDAAGAEVFDSRQDLFTIFDHFYINQNVFRRVIEGGATIDLDLSESHADFKIASTNHVSFQSYTGGYRAQCMIKKLDDNTIRLSHYDNGGTKSGTWRTLYQDTVLIVGR